MARGERLEIPEDEVELHVSFFLWQRSLKHSPAMDWVSPRWRHFRELFFRVVDRPPPPALIEPSRYHEWLVDYEPRRAQCIEAVRIAHLAATYTDSPPAGFFGTSKT